MAGDDDARNAARRSGADTGKCRFIKNALNNNSGCWRLQFFTKGRLSVYPVICWLRIDASVRKMKVTKLPI
jgi:hypothetical protein